ncbi:Serpin-ZX-like protein [Drosera capensis]
MTTTAAATADVFYKAKQVMEQVNSWVSKATKGLIRSMPIIPDESTTCILANALYFKGIWENEFEASSVKENVFHLLTGDTIRTPFMNQAYEHYRCGSLEDYKVIQLPYKVGSRPLTRSRSYKVTGRFYMYIFLPNEQGGLLKLMENLNHDASMFVRVELRRTLVTKLSISKFKFGSEHKDITALMQELGLTLPFTPRQSELDGMITTPDVEMYVCDIIHKTFIEVNEAGTEVAAVMAIPAPTAAGPCFDRQERICRRPSISFRYKRRNYSCDALRGRSSQSFEGIVDISPENFLSALPEKSNLRSQLHFFRSETFRYRHLRLGTPVPLFPLLLHRISSLVILRFWFCCCDRVITGEELRTGANKGAKTSNLIVFRERGDWHFDFAGV